MQRPKIENKWKMIDGCFVNSNKKVHTEDVHELLTSRMSKRVARGFNLPEINNGQLMTEQGGLTVHAASGKVGPIHFPLQPPAAVALQQFKPSAKLSPTSSLWLDWQHSEQYQCGFEKRLPAAFKQDYSNKVGSQLKRKKLPVCLPSVKNKSHPETAWSAIDLNNFHKLPEIREGPVRRSRTGQRVRDKNLQLPLTANMLWAEKEQ